MPPNKFPRQLLLDFEANIPQTFSTYIAGNNCPLVSLMQSLHPFEQGYDHSIYCWAEEGCGKSHLLRAYCAYWQQEGVRPLYFNGKQPLSSNLMDNHPAVLVFDNVHNFLGNQEQEEELLYLLRRAYDADIPLLLSATKPPRDLHCISDDLITRLTSFYVFHIHALDDDRLKEFIVMQAQKLGLNLSAQVSAQLQSYSINGDMKFLTRLLHRLARSTKALSGEEIEREWRLLSH